MDLELRRIAERAWQHKKDVAALEANWQALRSLSEKYGCTFLEVDNPSRCRVTDEWQCPLVSICALLNK